MDRPVPRITAAALTGVAGLHLLWATGSSFPFGTRAELADAVVGTRDVPSAGACAVVAAALLTSAALVDGSLPMPTRLRRIGVAGVSATLASRGALGILGRTALVSPGSSSERFRRLDRRVFSPLCLTLAAGTASALWGD